MRHQFLWAAGAALGLAGGGSLLWNRHAVSAAAAAPPAESTARRATAIAVDVYEVAPEALEVQVPATGSVLGRESVALVSELSRRLAKVRAEEGAVVRKGDPLFELDARDLHAELAKLEVQRRLAQVTLQRTERLHSEGLSNQQELDVARGRVDEIDAERQVLNVTLAKTLIRAPFSGTLGLRRVSEGAWVTPSTVLSTLQDTSELKVDFTLPERHAGSVRLGGGFRFRVDGQSGVFRGKIVALEPAVETVTRSLLVRGVVDGAAEILPGVAASIELPLRVEQALLVPAIAIVPGVEGRRVYVVRDGQARSVPVEVGLRTADRAQIVSGLGAGERVITSNLLRLRDGVAVQVTAGATSP